MAMSLRREALNTLVTAAKQFSAEEHPQNLSAVSPGARLYSEVLQAIALLASGNVEVVQATPAKAALTEIVKRVAETWDPGGSLADYREDWVDEHSGAIEQLKQAVHQAAQPTPARTFHPSHDPQGTNQCQRCMIVAHETGADEQCVLAEARTLSFIERAPHLDDCSWPSQACTCGKLAALSASPDEGTALDPFGDHAYGHRASAELRRIIEQLRFTPGQTSAFFHDSFAAENMLLRWASKWAQGLEAEKLAALRQAQPKARGTWQDIATAPKDGRTVLLWWRDDVGEWWGRGCWVENAKVGGHWLGQSFHSNPPGSWTTLLGVKPTHWQPLDAPKDTPDA